MNTISSTLLEVFQCHVQCNYVMLILISPSDCDPFSTDILSVFIELFHYNFFTQVEQFSRDWFSTAPSYCRDIYPSGDKIQDKVIVMTAFCA